jgi:hypothetical protein
MAEDKKQPRQVTLMDFLTGDQITQALDIWRKNTSPAQEIADKVISPNISQINAKLGQENDPKFLAYMCEAVFNETAKR